MAQIQVEEPGGRKVAFDSTRLNRRLLAASDGLPGQIEKVAQITSDTAQAIFDGITTEQLAQATIDAALQNVKDDPDYDTIAARLLLRSIYQQVLGSYETPAELAELHRSQFAH